jgi:hypothetical protein
MGFMDILNKYLATGPVRPPLMPPNILTGIAQQAPP